MRRRLAPSAVANRDLAPRWFARASNRFATLAQANEQHQNDGRDNGQQSRSDITDKVRGGVK